VIKSRRVTWAEHIACLGDMRNVYKISVGEAERKELLSRTRRGLEDGVWILKELGCEGMDSIHLAQDMDQWRALVNTLMNSRIA
jgi:hypothetical protein